MHFCKAEVIGSHQSFICTQDVPEKERACDFYEIPGNGQEWCRHCYDSDGNISDRCFSADARKAAIAAGELR